MHFENESNTLRQGPIGGLVQKAFVPTPGKADLPEMNMARFLVRNDTWREVKPLRISCTS
jgi:hypothetical protein